MPTTPGEHSREVVIFRPRGTLYDDVAALFLGGNPRYEDSAVVVTPDSRDGHKVQSVGLVSLNVSVVLRNFAKNIVFASANT